jgi:hypothetical protein
MKINYERFKELNLEALTEKGDQLSCFWIVQMGMERFIQDDSLSEEHKNLLIELGVLEESEEEKKTNLLNHKFTTNG